MILERLPDVQNLSTEEKWMLVDELQESLLAAGENDETNALISKELERRMAEYEANPATATTWEAIRDKLRARQ